MHNFSILRAASIAFAVISFSSASAAQAPASADAESASWIAISIADDGPGIPFELRERLFEPFVSGKPGGTGLGLPVVHRAVEAHRGVVLVDALARGTRFTVLLPAHASSHSGVVL